MKKYTKEIINKSIPDLYKEADVLRRDIAKKIIERKVKPDKNSNIIQTLKKHLAVILTVARQKELVKKPD